MVTWPYLRLASRCSDCHPVGLRAGRKSAGGIAERLAENAGGGEKRACKAISLLGAAARWRCFSHGTEVCPQAPRPCMLSICVKCVLNRPAPERPRSGQSRRLKRDDLSSNRHPALAFCLSLIFSENRSTLFGIMLQVLRMRKGQLIGCAKTMRNP